MKNIIKYILILIVCSSCVTLYTGCGQQDVEITNTYESPLSKVADKRNNAIISKFNNADEITVKYDMDKETDSFIDESIKDMERKGYIVSYRKEVESTRVMGTDPAVLYTVTEYQIITYKKAR